MKPVDILVVEDEAVVALDLEAKLGKLGHRVVGSAIAGEEAVEDATRTHPDLILMDIRLKGRLDGVSAARLIRERLQIPVVFVTAYSDEATVQRAAMSEPYGYVLKPFEERELQIAIELALYKHEMESKLRRVERWLATTLNSIGDAVLTADMNGIVTFINPVAEKLTGWSRDEAVGTDVDALVRIITEDKRAPVESPATRVLREGTIVGLDHHTLLIASDGSEIPIADSAAPIRDDRGNITGVVLVFRDQTEMRRGEQREADLQQQLYQSQKMEAVGRLAGGVAHDFNNLLTIIKGNSQLLLRGLGPYNPLRHFAEEIVSAGDRAGSLTRQLLAYSRKQVLRPIVIDLKAEISGMEDMMRRLIGEDVELVTGLDPDLGRVTADPGQLHQVILNLAVNARDAMPNGGKLTIEAKNVNVDQSYVLTHPDAHDGPHVMMAVSDTGFGMDSETLSHLFEPFFTTKELGKGTGLGLATIYGIIKQSGGHLWVYSEVGVGSTFTVYLPRVDAPADVVELAAPAPLPRGSGTVLVVEDENSVRKLIRQVLEQEGYSVLEAERGSDAIAVADRFEGQIRLLVTDMVMPGIGGRELAHSLIERRPDLKVLYMSGYAETAIVHHGQLDPGSRFISKPFTPVELARTVHDILNT